MCEVTCVWPKTSLGVPVTATSSPGATGTVLDTKTPSEVAASPSPASCRWKPSRPPSPCRSATTVPRTVTCRPASGVSAPLPWTAPTAVSSPGGTAHGSVAAGGGVVPPLPAFTAPLAAGPGPAHTRASDAASYVRDSDCPSGSVPASRTPVSVLVVPAAGPSVAATEPS